MKVFVTGANGFIGSRLIQKLVARGDQVRCLLRQDSDTTRLNGTPLERVTGDVRDAEAVREGARGRDSIIHLASPSGWSVLQGPEVEDVILSGTRNVLEAAASFGCTQTVFVSSTLALGGTTEPLCMTENCSAGRIPPGVALPRGQRSAEALCAEWVSKGTPVVVVSPGEVYGPNDTGKITCGNLIDFATSSPILVCRGGTSIVHVDDVAEGIIGALDLGKPGERYILGGDNLTIQELAEHTIRLLGIRRRILNIPNMLVRNIALVGQKLKLPLPFDPSVVPYATRFWFVDSRKAERELGVSFRSAVETLRPTLAWCRAQGYLS